jgi:tetratricopeptide (TPR) repeat protein
LKRNLSFHKQAEKIFSELSISNQWKAPIIIMAIYSTVHVYKDMVAMLAEKTATLEKEIVQIGFSEPTVDLVERIQAYDVQKTIFSVVDLSTGSDQEDARIYQYLNLHREFFIEESIRMIVWLKPDELGKMTAFAPDFWAFRHLMVDLTANRATPKRHAENLGVSLLVFPWRFADVDIAASLSYRQQSLASLPDVNETILMCANLQGEIAGLYFLLKKWDDALLALKNALAIMPEGHLVEIKGKILQGIAVLFLAKEDGRQAEAMCKKALALQNNHPECVVVLGQSQRKNGKNAEALKTINKALRLMPEDACSWNELGNIHFNLGHLDQSMAAYEKAFGYESDPRILLNQALVFLYRDQLDDVKKCLNGIPCETIRDNVNDLRHPLNKILKDMC